MSGESVLSTLAMRCCAWSERRFPDAFAFASMAVAVVAVASISIGVAPLQVARRFGSGFLWQSLSLAAVLAVLIAGLLLQWRPRRFIDESPYGRD